MRREWIVLFVMLLGGCSVQQARVEFSDKNIVLFKRADKKVKIKLISLTRALRLLSPRVNKKEAKIFAQAAVLYPHYLAEKYELVSPPYFQNFLITLGLKERGLCYHWASDLITYLKDQELKSFDLYRAVVNEGSMREHHAVVVTAKDRPFSEGIILDAWRNSSDLYFEKLKDDKDYDWVENKKYKVVRG